MKRTLQVFVGSLLLWLLAKSLDIDALAEAVGRLQTSSLLEAMTLFFLACGVAVSKWRLLWNKATWWQMLNANFTAQFYSMVLPGQLAGEVAKTLRMGHQFSDTTNIAASVLIDRVIGTVALVILACGGALVSRSAIATHAAWPLAVSAIGLLCALYAVSVPGIVRVAAATIKRIGDQHRLLWSASRKLIDFLAACATLLSNRRNTFVAVCLGIAFQATVVAINFIVASDLGISIGLADWSWIIGLVAISLLLPITVAGIGVREVTYVGLLGLFGVSIEDAFALSIVIFGISMLGALVGAIVELAHAIRKCEHRPQ